MTRARTPIQVRGQADWNKLPHRVRDARSRALSAVSWMRADGLSLTAAASKAGTTPATVRRYAAPALQQHGRTWSATNADRLFRRMNVLGPDGRTEVTVRGSRAAGRVAAHWNAVQHYLATGDTSPLRAFANKSVGGIRFLTDPTAIELEHNRGELALDDIYAQH